MFSIEYTKSVAVIRILQGGSDNLVPSRGHVSVAVIRILQGGSDNPHELFYFVEVAVIRILQGGSDLDILDATS